MEIIFVILGVVSCVAFFLFMFDPTCQNSGGVIVSLAVSILCAFGLYWVVTIPEQTQELKTYVSAEVNDITFEKPVLIKPTRHIRPWSAKIDHNTYEIYLNWKLGDDGDLQITGKPIKVERGF
jgi:hypothetical protein